MKRTVGIIGYGRFGKLAAHALSRRAAVLVHDSSLGSGARLPRGVRSVSRAEAASQKVVILAVPISRLEALLTSIRNTVLPGSLVLDVCSVKSLPLRWMMRILPRHVSIIGAHPLFGPDSASDAIKGHRVILCPGRTTAGLLRGVHKELRAAGLLVWETTPAEHDRLMAETLLLAQYLGRLPAASGIPIRNGSTPSYSLVRGLIDIAMNDSEQLFLDMCRFNPYATSVLRKLESGHRRLRKRITGSSR